MRYSFGGLQNKDYSSLGSILGSLILGNYHMFLEEPNLCCMLSKPRILLDQHFCFGPKTLHPKPYLDPGCPTFSEVYPTNF